MFLRLLFLAFLLTMTVYSQTPTVESGVPQTLARWRAANYSDVRYKLNLTLEKGAPELKGTIEIRLKNKADQIILDWRKIRGKEDLSKIRNVSVNGKPAYRSLIEPPAKKVDFGNTFKFEEINEHLVFKDGVVAGENVIKIDFTSPIATSGAAVTRYVDKEDGAEYVYSLFVPSDASTAFPVFDQPDLKARFQLNVTAPSGWKVISNMGGKTSILVKEPISDTIIQLSGQDTTEFAETKPISTYVFAFAAGDFAEVSEPPAVAGSLTRQTQNSNKNSNFSKANLQPPASAGGSDLATKIYVRKSQAEKFKPHAAETFRLNREAVKYLENYFDYKFPFPKYDLVLIPEFPFGGMEHAGATFLRESSVIFPSEPTANDFISRANLIFHEAAHQWFGDTVTMKWFDDLWLKEGFAEFMAYKTLEKVLPEYNAWKAFYERNKTLAYLTDSTRGTTPIYQEIPNLASAKSAYGNIVYRKAPSFLRQAEYYLGADKFQTAVRAFLKKHQFSNAEWRDLVKEFETASGQDLKNWANVWVTKRGLPLFTIETIAGGTERTFIRQQDILGEGGFWQQKFKVLLVDYNGKKLERERITAKSSTERAAWVQNDLTLIYASPEENFGFVFPNYQDYGYGIFLLDAQSRQYVLQNIQSEQDPFLRAMMWGTLWDSVREAELNPKDYVELAIKNISVETDELTIQTILNRVSTAMNYYLSDAERDELAPALENLLIEKIRNAPTLGRRITFYRAFLNVGASQRARAILKDVLSGKFEIKDLKLKTKDKFDIVTRLAVLGDAEAPQLLAALAKTETSDDAKRYAYAVGAGVGTKEAKEKYFNDFLNNKEISESWIEAAFAPFNSIRHAELTLPYLEKALAELPNLKRNRKIFFVNGWLAAFIGGQKDEKALAAVNKFLADNPNLDRDLRLKILENVDALERAVKIRNKFGQ